MRHRRWLAPASHPAAIYHCVSRVVDRRSIFGDAEKELFRGLLRELAEFCDVRVLTFCLMSNHFHILVEVPRPPHPLPNAEATLAALSKLSGRQDLSGCRRQLEALRRNRDSAAEQRWLARFHARRWNLSSFLQLLKQRFSAVYNRRVGRKGTLWEERFRSVLIEGEGRALVTVAAYIDLNPVRAGLVRDPKDYRWSGYGEAVAGVPEARAGVQRLVRTLRAGQELGEIQSLAAYRCHVYQEGSEEGEARGEDGRPLRGSLDRTAVLRVLAENGRLSTGEYLKCRVRYFCDGAVLGSREFVEGVFRSARERAVPEHSNASHEVRGLEAPALFVIRNLRSQVFG